MPHAWNRWEGKVVNGEFTLLRYLGGSERSGVFLTEVRKGERLLRAAIKLIPAGGENDELQLSRWRLAADLSHPHLIAVLDGGRCGIGGVPLLYVVMECAEENLAQVLPSRALTPAEAHEMLDSVLDVLAYLHGKGFVHGHIRPINIMAIGDQLKLSSDELCRAGELLEDSGWPDPHDPPEHWPEVIAATKTTLPAGDVWSLGMTLVETLTQNLPVAREAEQQEPLLPQSLPEPFLDIARHCLRWRPQDRWTVDQITARLQGRTPVPQVHAPLPQTHAPVRPPRPAAVRPSRQPAKRPSYTIPIAMGTVLVLASFLGPRLLRRHPEAPQVPTATLKQPAVPPAPTQAKQAPREGPNKASRPSVTEEGQVSEAPTPMPASTHPEPLLGEETNAIAKLPAGALVRGEVAHQVLPEVLESARNSIRGAVKVNVKVDVDRSGNVEGAELESRGPSKYFARAALDAAQLWKFKPPKIGGRGVLSSWTLQFEFTRDGTVVTPIQEIP
jgi:serine/threonine-protein kinase